MAITRRGERPRKTAVSDRPMTKSERILFLIELLKARGCVERGEAAEACGISERTLYRDLQTLARLNMPVVSDGPYILKTERVSIENFAETSDAELARYSRILETFISAIKWGMPLIITMLGEHRSTEHRHLARGIKLKRNGLCLSVLSYPHKKPADIPIARIVRMSAVTDGARDGINN